VLDITQQKRAERELASLNESLEQRVVARTRSLQQSRGRLAESERMLRALAGRIEMIREQERVDLAREIHDVLGQELTGLKMDGAWVLRRLAAPTLDVQHASERLHAMIQQIDSMVATVRRIATSLRPGVLDDLGLVAALQWQAREFEARSGIIVDIDVPSSEVAVDDARATAIFRIFQELLTNVARHAQASRVRAALSYEQDALTLDVADDGRGIDQPDGSRTTSLGLLGIRERAFAFGGELTLSAASAQGTLARVSIPLAKHEVQA
jgi:signal transduction histidine kinase